MYCAEYEAASGGELVDAGSDLLLHLLGGTERQYALGVAACSPEGETVAEFSLRTFWLHIRRGELDGIQRVDPVVDEILHEGVHGAAGVEKELRVCFLLDARVEPFLPGLDQLSVQIGGEEWAGLGAYVVGQLYELDQGTDSVQGFVC